MINSDLHLGDSRDVLKTLAENSVDSVVTDPPYALVSITKRFAATSIDDDTKTGDRSRRGADGYARLARGFMGSDWDNGSTAFDPEFWREVLRVLKPGGHLVSFGGTRTYHRMACAIEDAGFEIRDQIGWAFGSGFPKSHDAGEGRGTALKPAWEPICVARKPLIGTVAENVAAFGTGAINIDACRVPVTNADSEKLGLALQRNVRPDDGWGMNANVSREGVHLKSEGRWPANLIHDGSDEVLAGFPDSDGQQAAVGPHNGAKPSVNVYGDYGPRENFERRGDSGSAARFFYCAKASRLDREEGCDGLPDAVLARSNIAPTQAALGNVEDECGGAFNGARRRKNNHPTVKPTTLMRYLCRLVTPAGGVILDPFMGSGSTGKAAMLEGFRFIGIEREPNYMEIASARIAFGLKNRNFVEPDCANSAQRKPVLAQGNAKRRNVSSDQHSLFEVAA